MNDTRANPEVDSRRPLRAQRREAGLVAQYINELSGRHGGKPRAEAGAGARPDAGPGAVHGV